MPFITRKGTIEATRTVTTSSPPSGSVPVTLTSVLRSKAKSQPRALRARRSWTGCVRCLRPVPPYSPASRSISTVIVRFATETSRWKMKGWRGSER